MCCTPASYNDTRCCNTYTKLGILKLKWYPVYSIAYAIGSCVVPLFLMISGTLLLDPAKDESFSKGYKKMPPYFTSVICVCNSLCKNGNFL